MGILAVLLQATRSVGMRGTVALFGGGPAGAQFSLDHLTTLWSKKVVGILGGEGCVITTVIWQVSCRNTV